MPNRVLTPVTELDFDRIKENLKNYLSTTEEFSDYNFEGSGMSVLLDLLAYNTHYTAMYANMLAAESFLDSAVLRKSIVSLAKNLGYVPNSMSAASATVDVAMGTTSGVPSSIPAGSKFSASKDGINYPFTLVESFSIDKSSEPYNAKNVVIRQGQFKSVSFIYDPDSNSVKFEIPNRNIDKSLTKVYVMNSSVDMGSADISWKENSDYLELTPTTKVYFINENHKGNYQISFGDGILGAAPSKGNYIVVQYFETSGSEGNDIGRQDTVSSSFVFSGIQGNDFDSTITTVSYSSGGSDRDNEEKIRYTATKYYQSQDRAVTTSDYESIILKEYSAADAVRIWGGEDNNPPEFGKIFISVLPKNSPILSDSQKRQLISDVLNKKKMLAVSVELVDPDYTYIMVDCFGTYDSNKSITNEMLVKNAIRSSILRYSGSFLETFGNVFRYSVLSRQIDLSSNTLLSNRISTRLMKKLIPLPGNGNYVLNFGVPLNHPFDGNMSVISTNTFSYRNSAGNIVSAYIEDDGYGVLSIYGSEAGKKTTIKENVGSVDYSTGKVSLVSFFPASTGSLPYIRIQAIPDQKFDIVPKRNQILLVDSSIPDSIIIQLQDAATRNI